MRFMLEQQIHWLSGADERVVGTASSDRSPQTCLGSFEFMHIS